MVVRSQKIITPIYWVPPICTANYTVTVERTDGTVDDITDLLINLKIEDGVTESIGNFEFEIPNPNETYTSAWTGMEIFRFYCDYAPTPSTLRFRGRIEKPSKKDCNVKVTGRSESLFVQDQQVNKQYVDVDAGYAIKDLFDTYGESRFDTSEINISIGEKITLTFSEYAFWDAIEAICLAVGYDCYIDASLVVQFFEAGSVNNTTDAIIDDMNMLEVKDFASDSSFIKNQIRVIGGTIDGVQVVYTANDTTSQPTYGIRRKNIKDDGILTFDAAKDLADFVLAQEKDPPEIGEVDGVLLATIQPGENIQLSSEINGLIPKYYRILSYKHTIDNGFGKTTVKVNKEARKLSHVMKDRVQNEFKNSKSEFNADDLDFSEIELFNSDTGSGTNTSITDGVLKSTSAGGIWLSDVYETPDGNDFNKLRIGLVASDLSNIKIEYSTNNGETYTVLERDTLKTGLTGKRLLIKLTLALDNIQIDSIRVQYSTS